MQITPTVRIGGQTYTVTKLTRPCKSNVDVDGEIVYDMSTIAIREGLEEGNDYKNFVFIHEILHGIFNHMCIEQDEALVSKISKGLHMVINDNPDIFK